MSHPVLAYILAGGKSSRFGSDKARARIEPGGQALICRVADAVRPLASPIVIADQPGRYADLGLATIGDLTPGLGPLGGLQTALHHCRAESHILPVQWLLLLSCDLVNLEPRWLEDLLAARQEDSDAVAYRDACWEPLCALYHTRLYDEVNRRIQEHQLAMQALLNAVRTRALPRPPRWAHANTPDELRLATTQDFTLDVE